MQGKKLIFIVESGGGEGMSFLKKILQKGPYWFIHDFISKCNPEWYARQVIF